MNRAAPPELILLPPLKAQRGPDGTLRLTKKYIEGTAEFARFWPGRITSLVAVTDAPSTDMDLEVVDLDAAEPRIEPRPADGPALAERLGRADCVLAHLWRYEALAAAACSRVGTPIHFISEYTPRTEAQIIDAETSNPILRFRRKLWMRRSEIVRRRMLRDHAAGLQCSGTPAWDHYRPFCANAHLFFDNRVRAAHVMGDAALAAKCAGLLEGRPLRLVFGGRLVAMKGVLDLPRVARSLIGAGVDFTLDIVGSGPLEEPLRRAVAALGDARVRVRPPMDFRTGWTPFLQREADLFLCCHPQGDPSSTYPEVMSCGVPIVGYDNEAWRGVRREAGAGWVVPIGDVAAMADRVAALHADRGAIAKAARDGRDFAARHCFERTAEGRMAHLAQALRA
jgi:glycosyltransferase involved in cell wall biosynthesis